MLRLLLWAVIVTGPAIAQETLPYQHLAEYLAGVKNEIPKRGSNAFLEPSEKGPRPLHRVHGETLRRQDGRGAHMFDRRPFLTRNLKNAGVHRDYLVAFERHNTSKGLGTYIVDPLHFR